MFLKEYMRHRGVNANALTAAEAKLIGVDTSKRGWVKASAAVVVPDALAEAAERGAKRDDLRAIAAALLAKRGVQRRKISAMTAEQIAELSAEKINPKLSAPKSQIQVLLTSIR